MTEDRGFDKEFVIIREQQKSDVWLQHKGHVTERRKTKLEKRSRS